MLLQMFGPRFPSEHFEARGECLDNDEVEGLYVR